MSEAVVHFVTNNSYYAIFIMVFLQEIGVPNPVPNELILAFSGYLSYKGLLSTPIIIITAISADFTGTGILYFIFYKAGSVIKKKPRWIPLSPGIREKLKLKISSGGQLSIYLFRLTPFIRGYTSAISGLLQIKPLVFLPVAFASAITWASICVITGSFAGPSWKIIENIGRHNYLLTGLLAFIATFSIILCFILKRKNPDLKNDLEVSGRHKSFRNSN